MTARRDAAGVGVLAFGHLTNDSYTFLLPALLPVLLDRLDIGLAAAGLLIALYQASSSFTQPLFGHLGDRGGRRRWMTWAGVAMSGIGAGALGLAGSVWGIALALLFGGLGSGIFHPASASLVAGASPRGARTRWMSLYITAGNFGLPLGPFVIGSIVAATSFSGIWIVSLPAVAVALLTARLAPPDAPRTAPHVGLRAIVREHGRMLTGLISVSAVRGWANALAISFLPLYGVSLGASVVDSARLLSLYLVAGAVGTIAGGWLGDRYGRDRLIVASLIAAAPFCGSLTLQDTVGPVFLVATAVTGLLLNGSFVLLAVRGQESLPGNVGMVSGVMLGLSIGIGGLAVAPMAVVAERAGIAVVFVVAAALAIVAALVMPFVPRPPVRAAVGLEPVPGAACR